MHQADLLETFLRDLAEQTDGLDVYTRVVWRYPFDLLATATLRKARTLGEAVVVLLRANLDEEAYGVGRSLVELAMNLRYITADPSLQEDRTLQYLRHAEKYKEFWLHWSIRRAPDEASKREFIERGNRLGLKADAKAARLNWTGEGRFIETASEVRHALDPKDLEADYKELQRAVDYTMPSAFVHCSATALNSRVELTDYKLTARGSGKSSIDFGLRASNLAFHHVHSIVTYVLYGLKIPIPSRFTCLWDSVQNENDGYDYVPTGTR